MLLIKGSQESAPFRDVLLTSYEVECCQYNVEKIESKAVRKTRESSYVLRNSEGRTCNHRCSVKAMSTMYSECASVALVIHRAMRMRQINL